MATTEEKVSIREMALKLKEKSYIDLSEKDMIWKAYEKLFGKFIGNEGCQECQREALKKIIIETSND